MHVDERDRIHKNLDQKSIADVSVCTDPEYMMTSPFYDNQHAELGRRSLFAE